MFPKFPMCSKPSSLSSLSLVLKTLTLRAPSSRKQQRLRRNNSKFEKKPVSGSRPNQCRMFGFYFFCCFCDVELLGLSFGFYFFSRGFRISSSNFFPLVFELPFRHKNNQEGKKWKHPSLHLSSSCMR